MKVAYLLVSNPRAVNAKLRDNILPQLTEGKNGIEVVGLFFFDDNIHTLRTGNPLGERVMEAAAARDIPVFICQSCAIERKLAEPQGEQARTTGLLDGIIISNYPDPFIILTEERPNNIITI